MPEDVSPLVMTGATTAADTVSVSVAEPVPPEFDALIVTLVVPALVGVPLITPVLVFTDKPAGSDVAL